METDRGAEAVSADPIPGQIHHDAEWQRGHDALDRAHATRDLPLSERVRDLARQRDKARAFAAHVEAQNAHAKALHYDVDGRCGHCGHVWPCETVAALDGAL
jgi:hypothetical protein